MAICFIHDHMWVRGGEIGNAFIFVYLLNLSATTEEVTRRAGAERLRDTVTTRRRKMAGHTLRLQREIPSHTGTMYACQETAAERKGDRMAQYIQRRHRVDGCQLA